MGLSAWALALAVFLYSVTAFSDVVDFVDPRIGTAIHNDPNLLAGGLGGNTHPGAAYPFGMIIWSPDTERVDSSVYEYTKDAVNGFSLTHLSGPGCVAGGDFSILPVLNTDYISVGYTHRGEVATPGYYAVTLENGIQLELTVSERSGLGHFIFPASGGNLALDTGHIPAGPVLSHVEQISDHEIIAWIETGYFCGGTNRTMVNLDLQSQTPFEFKDLGNGRVALHYPANTDAYVKVALSYVSVDGARANLTREIPNWDFAAVKTNARQAWLKRLSTIQVESDDTDRLKIFYTAFYHSLLHPNIFSDVPNSVSGNADYPRFNSQNDFATYHGKVAQVEQAQGYVHYANVSGWDTYRSQAQLLAWLFPEVSSDMMKSLVSTAEQCGALPRWAEYNNDTGVMNGDPGAGIVASSYAFGARNFKADEALNFMILSGLDPTANCYYYSRPGLAEYMKYGYIPDNTQYVWGAVATSLEYNVADYSVSQLAKALGNSNAYNFFYQRSLNWKLNFDSGVGYPRRRLAAGTWYAPFDSLSLEGFVEGNAQQYVWFVPQDAKSLIQFLGGNSVAISRLDHHFSQLNSGPNSEFFYIGNEPSFNTPWLYNYTDKPSRTQNQVRTILLNSFTSQVDGLPGNDDLGAMSSWYVWSAIGLYPTIPGAAKLTLTSPEFKKVTIALPQGKTLTLNAPNAPLVYIQSIQAAAQPLTTPWLPETMIFNGGTVDFTLGGAPNDSIWSQ